MCALRRLSVKLLKRPSRGQSLDQSADDQAQINSAEEKQPADPPPPAPVTRDEDQEAVAVDETQAFVSKAEVTGVTERHTRRKKFVYRIKLDWSDGSVTHSYRGYTDFFHFQCRLLDLFPEEAGQEEGKERVIPFLPGRAVLRRSNLRLAQERLPEIHEYVLQMFELSAKISKCQHVLRFFKSDWPEDIAISNQRGDHQKHYEMKDGQMAGVFPISFTSDLGGIHFSNPRQESNLDDSIQFECSDPDTFTSQIVAQEIV